GLLGFGARDVFETSQHAFFIYTHYAVGETTGISDNFGFQLQMHDDFSVGVPYWFVAGGLWGMGIALFMRWFQRFPIRMISAVAAVIAIVLGLMIRGS